MAGRRTGLAGSCFRASGDRARGDGPAVSSADGPLGLNRLVYRAFYHHGLLIAAVPMAVLGYWQRRLEGVHTERLGTCERHCAGRVVSWEEHLAAELAEMFAAAPSGAAAGGTAAGATAAQLARETDSARTWLVRLFLAATFLARALDEEPASGRGRCLLRWAVALLNPSAGMTGPEIVQGLSSGTDPLVHTAVATKPGATACECSGRSTGHAAGATAMGKVAGRICGVRRHRYVTFLDVHADGDVVQLRLDSNGAGGGMPPDRRLAGHCGPVRKGDWISVAVGEPTGGGALPVVAWLGHSQDRLDRGKGTAGRPSGAALRVQSQVLRVLASRLYDAGFLQVASPVLTDSFYGGDCTPFLTVKSDGAQTKALRVTAELALKSVIWAGYRRCFEIGPMFRNESEDRSHLNSFTMLEAYAADLDVAEMARLIALLISECASAVGRPAMEARVCTAGELIAEHLGILISRPDGIAELAARLGMGLAPGKGTAAAVVSKALLASVIPKVPQLLVIDGLPCGGSPLIEDSGSLALRRWIAVGGRFVADIAQEEADFETVSAALRRQLNEDRYPVRRDYSNFLRLLASGFPRTAGAGLSISALVAALADLEDVREILVDQWQR